MRARHSPRIVLLCLLPALLSVMGLGCSDDEGGDGLPEVASIVTFNTGLIEGFVPLARARFPAVRDAIAASDYDVICLQEVWEVADVEAIIAASADTYADSYWVDSTEEPLPPVCTDAELADLVACADTNACETDGRGLVSCVLEDCAAEVAGVQAANPECLNCMASQLGQADPTIERVRFQCVEVESYSFSAQGRNGLLLLSKHAFTVREAIDLDAFITRRYALHVEVDLSGVGPTDVYCTHLTTSQAIEYLGNSDSWADENADQIEAINAWIGETASTGQVIWAGDFNTAPQTASYGSEDPENYALIPEMGFSNPYIDDQADPACTFCESNDLRPEADDRTGGKLIDHIFLSGFEAAAVTMARIFDELVQITTDEGTRQTNLSDHFGVSLFLTP